jgi:hypothetical protein
MIPHLAASPLTGPAYSSNTLRIMTTPPKSITVECPRCATRYDDWYRPSLNFDIEDFDADYVREATTATCPKCSTTVTLDTLVVRDDVWTMAASRP